MKKYKFLKWLVLAMTIFTVLCFALPLVTGEFAEIDDSIGYRYNKNTGEYCYDIDTNIRYYYNESTGEYCYNINKNTKYRYAFTEDRYYYDYDNRTNIYDDDYDGDYYYDSYYEVYYHCSIEKDYDGSYYGPYYDSYGESYYYFHCSIDKDYDGEYIYGYSGEYYHAEYATALVGFGVMFGTANRFNGKYAYEYYDYYNFDNRVGKAMGFMWPAFAVALAALAFAILPIVSKDEKGFNKKGNIHKSLIISLPLCFVAVVMNLLAAIIAFHWCNPTCAGVWFAIVTVATIAAGVLLAITKKKIISIDFCGYLEGPMVQGGKWSVCISKGACLAWSAGNSDIVLSKETVKSVEPANKTVSDVVDGKRQNFDVYNVTMADGQEGTLNLLHAHAGSVVRAMSDLVVVTDTAAPRGERAKDGKTTVSTDDSDDEEPASIVDDLLRPLPPDSLIGKPLDWFTSEEGLEAYKIYMTPQNYILQERILKSYKSMSQSTRSDYFLDMDFFERDYLPIANAGAKLPQRYFYALLKSIKAEPLKNPVVFDLFLSALQLMAKPYVINDDGEPELCATVLTPEQIVSIDKNPLLYFVKNFNVFKMKDDDMGQVIDKFYAFNAVVRFILQFVNEIEIEKTEWLFDRDTYLNDFGMVRKIKGFIKKCKELTDNDKYNEFFDLVLEKLLADIESHAQRAPEEEKIEF